MLPKYIDCKKITSVDSVKDQLATELIICRGSMWESIKEALVVRHIYYTSPQDVVNIHIGTWLQLSKRFKLVNRFRTLKRQQTKSL